ncbi:MAG: hypothetical protein AAGA75_14750 [Cyanobacteria bacterium P01_E01_bin.6]
MSERFIQNKRLQKAEQPHALRIPLGSFFGNCFLQLSVSGVEDAAVKLNEFRQAEIRLAQLHRDADFFDRN